MYILRIMFVRIMTEIHHKVDEASGIKEQTSMKRCMRYSRHKAALAVSFSGFIFSSSWIRVPFSSEAVLFVLMEFV